MKIQDGSNLHTPQGLDRRLTMVEEMPWTELQPVQEVDLQELFRKLWRRKGVILGTIITVMAITMIVLMQLTPRYTAVTLVEIGQRQTNVVDFEAVLAGLPADASTVETEIRVIGSRKLARRTIEKLQLSREPEFNPALRAPSAPTRWLNALLGGSGDEKPPEESFTGDTKGESERVEFIGVFLDKLTALFGGAEEAGISDVEKLDLQQNWIINEFLDGLDVEPEGVSRVVAIKFESETPRIASRAANTLAEFYIVAQLEAKFEATKRANDWLGERIMQLRQDVEIEERVVENYRKRTGLIRGRESVSLTEVQISEISTQHVLEKTRLAEAVARLRQTERLLNTPGRIETATAVLASPLIQNLRQAESQVERQVAEFSVEYGERHPTMINARAELRDLRAKIKTEINKIIEGLRNEVAIARARSASLNSALEKLKRQVANLNTEEVQLRALEREAAASRALLETLLARAKETSSQQDFQQPDANILSAAAIPQEPSFPQKGIILAMAFVLAILLGALLVMVIERLDSGFRSMEQVERLMGVVPLGLVPALKGLAAIGRKPEGYILEKPASAFGEAIRSLHTNLLLSDADKRPKVILITSTLPKEGKTTVVVSLARMLASIGQKVLVIDCDLRRPALHKIFGLDAEPGLVECINGEIALDELIGEDKYSGAHLLPAGGPTAHPPNLLSSDLMKDLLNTLSQRYDVIILDSAPVLAVSDSLVLSRVADKIVFLIRWVETRRGTAINGLKQIVDSGGDVAGALLTMVDVKEHAQYGFGDSGSYAGQIRKYYTG